MSGTAQKLVRSSTTRPRESTMSGMPVTLDALEHRVVHSHVVSLGADRVFALGIEDHEIGVAADRDRSFARIQTKKLRRSGGNQFDKSIHAETSLGDAAGINQTHAMFNAGPAVWNLGEVAASEFFLLLETEWTVIGGNNLQMIALETVPEFFLMPFFAKRRSENIFRAFETGNVKVFDATDTNIAGRFRHRREGRGRAPRELFRRASLQLRCTM